MLKKRIKQLEEQNKKKSTEYKDFNEFYEGLKRGDADTIANFDCFYNEAEVLSHGQ